MCIHHDILYYKVRELCVRLCLRPHTRACCSVVMRSAGGLPDDRRAGPACKTTIETVSCISFTVEHFNQLQRILKGFTSLVAQRVFDSMTRIMQPGNRGLACRRCRIPSHFVYSILPVAERTIFGFGCMNTCVQ